jgi:glucosamine kinase
LSDIFNIFAVHQNNKKMQLIADSGSTKVDWRAIYDDGTVKSISTEGINPVFHNPDTITNILRVKLLYELGPDVEEIYFYGAGVVSANIKEVLSHCFKMVFPKSVCYAESDVLAAARALCGRQSGIACILGTGSNSCFYDGKNIVKNVCAGGFILGDEASGAYLGKRLISDFIKGLLPKDLEDDFQKRYKLDYGKIVDIVYKQQLPSRFLASFSPFLNEYRENLYIANLLRSSFSEFFNRNIYQYDYMNYPIGFVGSIAYYFKDFLNEVAESKEMRIGKILKAPIDGLTDYHKGLI